MCRDVLPVETFMHWWNGQPHWWNGQPPSRDFWIETEEYMYRIHVTPRRTLFDPSNWQTSQTELRDLLLQRLGTCRESTCIPCHARCHHIVVEHSWKEDHGPRAEFLWIGRSRFQRNAQAAPRSLSSTAHVHEGNDYLAMEDEARGVGGVSRGWGSR